MGAMVMQGEFCETPNGKFWKYIEPIGEKDGKLLRAHGPFDFSFDKKTVYSLWADWDKLTGEQQDIFAEEYPVMAELKGYPYSRKKD